MPLQVVCPACNAKLKAPDTAAGKKTKCPKCQAIVTVPADAPQAPSATTNVKLAENWYMQTTDGSQFGPVPRSELNDWFKEGRISADCQLLKEGADQWQWASEIYPSLDQSAPAPTPSKSSGSFDFLGPATPANNDPLGLGNAALGTPISSSSLSNYQAPAFPAATPSFGGGGGYGVSTNPYSSPSSSSYSNYGSSYGRQTRSSMHPMVIVAAIIEFFYGALYAIGALLCFVLMIVLLVGGASLAANMPGDNPNAENLGPALAGLTGLGLVCILPFMILFLALSILLIYTGIGLLKRRFWAKIVSIVVSILFMLVQMLSIIMAVMSLEPCSLVTSMVGFALFALILVPMCIPDWTSDFS